MIDKTDNTFLPQRGNYKGLVAYQKAECIYDLTFYFASTYLEKGDRTVDQMVQAARSGKQNIAEGVCGQRHLPRDRDQTYQCRQGQPAGAAG